MTSDMLLHDMLGIQKTYSSSGSLGFLQIDQHKNAQVTQLQECFYCAIHLCTCTYTKQTNLVNASKL